MTSTKIFLLLSVFVFLTMLTNGQSLEELRKKKKKTNEQIKFTTRLLDKKK